MSGGEPTSRGRPRPIERFLGSDALGGPDQLLGVDASRVSEEQIIAALERRLSQVDEHAHGMTPEADEVRLALHAGAAQLLDRAARARQRENAQPSPPVRARGRALSLQLERDAVLTLARYGGWNRRALRRLTMLAVARGAGAEHVASVLRHLAHSRSPAASGRARTEPRSTRIAPTEDAGESREREDRGGPGPGAFFGAIATLLTAVVVIAVVLILVTTGSDAPNENGDNGVRSDAPAVPPDLPMARGEELFPWKGEPGEAAAPEAPAPRAFTRLSDALVGLETAVAGLEVDPAQAVAVFGDAIEAIGREWCKLTPSQRRATQHDVVEFVYRAVQRQQLAAEVVRQVARGADVLADPGLLLEPESIWPASWSVGLLARLAREQELGATASRLVDARLKETVGSAVAVSGGFEQGVQTALWGMLPAMLEISDAEEMSDAWERWTEAAASGGDLDRSLVAALEWVLVVGDEPSESEGSRAAIDHLVTTIDWGAGSRSRPWLVRMFEDPRVSTGDIHAVTTSVVRRSAAPGVDVTMALPVRASDNSRVSLRERYATVWGLDLDEPLLDELASDWLEAATRASAQTDYDGGFVEGVALAAALSRLNEAAALRHAGRLDEAGVLIDEYDRPIERELAQMAQASRGDRASDGPGISDWAMRYLSAQRDFAERLRLLKEAGNRDINAVVDAEVLATEAVRGAPAQAREAARSALLAQRPKAVLSLALLEIAPIMPRTPQNADLVSALTGTLVISTDDPDWKLKTRRVLVQSALERMAAEGEQGVIDAIATVLAASYAGRAYAEAPSGGSPPSGSESPAIAGAWLRTEWERRARESGLGAGVLEIESALARHAARERLAQGPVQVFAAEQVAAFELMSIVVASERLDRGAEIMAVRRRLREDRTAAGDLVEQIVATERAFLALWAIRLGQEVPG